MQPSLQQENHAILAMIPRRTLRNLKSGMNTLTYLQTQLASKTRPRNSSSHYSAEEKTSLNLPGMQVSQTQMHSLDAAITKIRALCKTCKHVNGGIQTDSCSTGNQVDYSIFEGNRRTCYAMSIHRIPVHEEKSH